MKLPYILPKSKLEWILWIVLLLILFGAFFGFDYLDGDSSYTSESSTSEFDPRDLFKGWSFEDVVSGEEPEEPVKPSPAPSTPLVDFNRFNWAPWASAWALISLIGFFLYVKGIYLIHDHAERNGRNRVRWTTASVVFSPFLAGLIYLLTWPEKRRRGA